MATDRAGEPSRRSLLLGSAALAGAHAAGFGPAFAETRRVLTASHWGTFEAVVTDGRLTDVVPFARDTRPTPMIGNFPGLVHGASRIRHPAVRRSWLEHGPGAAGERRGADPFVRVDWETALDLVAAELRRVRETHGHDAILGGSYGWASAGIFHHARSLLRRFLALGGGYVDQLNNYSYGAGMVLLPHVTGGIQPITGPIVSWPTIIANTRLIVAFGGAGLKNSQITSGGMGDHTTAGWLRRAREAGIDYVVVNPVHEDMCDLVDAERLWPRPNTDVALMLGLAHTLHGDGRHDRGFLDRCTVGFDRFEAYLTGAADGVAKSADWQAPITGIPADTVRALARRMADNRTMVFCDWALQRADHGEQTWWMTVTLAAMLGQIGLPGGGFGFSYTSTNGLGQPRANVFIPPIPVGPNRVRQAIPVARIADMLLDPGGAYDYDGRRLAYPDIRLVYWAGGNPFHHHQDTGRLLRAWARPETVIVHDSYWTATAKRADIVLPATTTLERDDICSSSRDRYIVAMRQAIPPEAEARDDYAILTALAERLGHADRFTQGRDAMAWLRHLYETGREDAARGGYDLPDFDRFWPDGWFELPADNADFILFADFRADPAKHRLRTPSGRIELFSETIAAMGHADIGGHARWYEPKEWLGSAGGDFPLHLLTTKPKHRLHSQMDAGPVNRAHKVAGREPIWINPADAGTRGIRDGDVVRVSSPRGQILCGALVTERVRPQVAVMYSGAWYDPLDPADPASLDKHGNANVLVADRPTSSLSQGPNANSCLVEIERYDGDPPPVTAFDPPAGA